MTLTAKLRKSHFLFLGYGLRDWNLRVILHRIAGEQRLNYKSWAIQRHPTDARSRSSGAGATWTSSTSTSRATSRPCADGLRLLPQADGGRRMRDCPYAGLMPFTEEQADFFFGREAEREIITANLMASRLTLLYGPSGVGKSSVLNAGVAHHLRAEPGASRPRQAPEFGIVIVPRRGATIRWRASSARSHARVGRAAAGRDVRRSAAVHATEAVEGDLLIILDQFEEYFLYHRTADGDGTFAVEFPRVGQPARPARELPRLDARGLDRQARFLQGPDPEPLRQLPADRSPRARARRATPSSSPIEQFNQTAARRARRR